MMKDRRYKDAMNKLPISEDFERRTMERLQKPRRRPLRIPVAIAACLALLLAVGIPLNRLASQVQPDTLPERSNRTSGANAPALEPMPEMAEAAPAAGMADGQDGSILEWNTEEYSHLRESGFLATETHPLSTFAADVDTASYSNLRRMLLAGDTPPVDAVRIEEMINYFSYDYPEPEGKPLSVTTEVAPCPWNEETRLLLIGLQAEKLKTEELPRSNLVFLIDVSGSMDMANKLPLVKQAFALLCEGLREGDRVSIVTYAARDEVVLFGADGSEREAILAAINNLRASGSTNGESGIQTAYRLAQENFIEGGNNRVLLVTDGDLNVGVTSEGELTRLVEEKRETGVFLSVLGFGTGNYKDNKLEALADHGNGNYSYIDTIHEARRVLVEEMGATFHTVCKDVKLQVEFNPEIVKGYRLIGYENRLLQDADFADDQKDGGELGSGHAMTAIYEIVPADSEMEVPGSALRYQRPIASGSEELATVSVRWKPPEAGASEMASYAVLPEAEAPSRNMLLASAVAQAGMLLRSSEWSGTATWDSILEQIDAIPEPDDSIREFRDLVTRMKALS